MRLKLVQLAMAGFLILGIAVPVAFTQGPGGFPPGGGFPPPGGEGGFGKGGFGRGGGGGGKGFQPNPDMFFAMMAGRDKDGKPNEVIVVKDYNPGMFAREPAEKTRERMNAYLAKIGDKSGTLTKETFKGYFEEQRAERERSMGGGKGDWGKGDWGKGPPPGEEKKAGPPPSTTTASKEKDLNSKPVVFRYGKLPTKELPSWFPELDTDKDGQVGLYEWRAASRSLTEFKTYDLNGDGFITAEEVIAYQKVEDAKKDPNTLTFARAYADPGSDEAEKGQGGPSKVGGSKGDWGKGSKGSWGKSGGMSGWGGKGGGMSGWGDKSGKGGKGSRRGRGGE